MSGNLVWPLMFIILVLCQENVSDLQKTRQEPIWCNSQQSLILFEFAQALPMHQDVFGGGGVRMSTGVKLYSQQQTESMCATI